MYASFAEAEAVKVMVETLGLQEEVPTMAVSEFQRTLMNILSRHGMSVATLAEHTGYNPLLLDNLIVGKSRQIPADFFIRVADVLSLTTEEKNALICSWAFGTEKRSWHLSSA
jgi:hypothetical protein